MDIKDKEQEALAQKYKAKQRPLCPCREPGLEMYIAKINGKYVVKRIPNTGVLHSPECDSYEPPPELSGLGEVLGSAIQEDTDSGLTELKFGFSMTKVTGKAAPTKSEEEPNSVKTDGNKLTIKSVLHYLWEEAGFNKWSPAMEGKRSWTTVRKYLLQAAENKLAKGSSLVESLYIPEHFVLDNKDAINHRRMAQMSKITAGHGKSRPLAIVIGAVKDISQSRYGHKIIVKHSPDFPFMLNDDIHKRMVKLYESELQIWEAFEDINLVVIATFSVSAAGIGSIEEIALMPVTANWIPFEHIFDKAIIDTLTKTSRRFTKGLRYNLSKKKPLASVVLSDTDPEPTAMYVIPVEAEEGFITELETLKEESHLTSWVWNTSEFEMPEIPPATTQKKAVAEKPKKTRRQPCNTTSDSPS